MVCRKCGSSKSVKNGKRGDAQCYKCSDCGFQYTREDSRGHSEAERSKAIALYLLGLSMRVISKLFHVNVSTILYWVRNFATKNYTKPTPQGPIVIELDEMWHFIKSKKTNAGYGKLIAVLPASSSTGNVEIVVAQL
jgi:transposase-like protein